MPQFDLTTSLADAAFNAEKKRRRYDPKTGYYIDPISGISGPDVQPYDRPGFLARTFSPNAQELIGYNRQWVDKPREAQLSRNIETNAANERFQALTPKEQNAYISGERAKALFGAGGNWTGASLEAHEKGMADVAANIPSVTAEANRLQQEAAAVENENKRKQAEFEGTYNIPESTVTTQLAANKYKTGLFGAEERMRPAREAYEQANLSDKLADLTQVSPYRRANEVTQQRDIIPQQLINQGYREREVAPVVNQTDRSKALIGQHLADVNLGQKDVLADTQRYQNFGNRLIAQYMGENPVKAMSQNPYGVLNNEGGLDLRLSKIYPYADMDIQDIQESIGKGTQTRFSLDGQPLPTPPPLISEPLGTIGTNGTPTYQQSQELVGGTIPSRGASLGIPSQSPIMATLGPVTPGIAAEPSGPAGWTPDDMVKAQQNNQIARQVRPLSPEEQQVTATMHQEFRDKFNKLPQGSIARRVVGDLLNQAIADEVGIQNEFIGASDVGKSIVKTMNKAMQDPIIKAKIDNLSPHQVARAYQKVWEGLIERGLIKNESPKFLGIPLTR